MNESILKRRWKKFKTLKRGYYSLLTLTVLYTISFFLPILINNRALIVKYDDSLHFPIFSGYISGEEFGQDVPGEAKYRKLKEEFSKNGYIFPTKYLIYMIDNAFESLLLELQNEHFLVT